MIKLGKNDDSQVKDSYDEFKQAQASKGATKEKYVLRLYISGMTQKSLKAIDRLKKICEDQLKGCYDLQIIDISQEPESVKKEDIIATPTLIKELPKPIRRIIGDLTDTERILVALNVSQTKK